MNYRNLALLVLGQCTLGATAPMLVLINGFIGAALAPSEALATFGMGTLVAGTALATVPAARLAQRRGRRFGFILAAALSMLGSALAIASIYIHSFSLFCGAMFVLGTTLAFMQQFRFAAAENAGSGQISLAVSLILFAGIGAAMVGPRVGVAAANWLPELPYAGSFVALSLLSLICMAVMSFYRSQSKPSQVEAIPVTRAQLWQPGYVLGVLCGTTSFSVMSLVMTATPISMHHHQGLPLGETASVIQWHIVAMFVPSLFTGYLIKRLGVEWVALLGIVVSIACVAMALSGVSLQHYLMALILLGLGWNALFMAGTHWVAVTHSGEERFQAQATNDFIVFACQGVASLSAGFMLALIGWQGLNLVALAMLLVCMMVWFHLVLIKQAHRIRVAI